MNTRLFYLFMVVVAVAFSQKPPDLTETQQRELLFDLAELKAMESEIQAFHAKAIEEVNKQLQQRQEMMAKKRAEMEKRIKDLGVPDDHEIKFDSQTRKVVVVKRPDPPKPDVVGPPEPQLVKPVTPAKTKPRRE
jgi:hypothetical protein